jgi:hypothetical protein
LERVFQEIEEYWVNIKYPLIPTSVGGENIRELNKALRHFEIHIGR